MKLNIKPVLCAGTAIFVLCRFAAPSVAQTPEPLATFAGGGRVLAVALTPSGRILASANQGGEIKLWDVPRRELLVTLTGHKGRVNCLAISPDGKILASGGSDKALLLWDIATGDGLAAFKGHKAEIWSVAFSPNGKYLAYGLGDGTARVGDGEGKTLPDWLEGQRGAVYGVAFSPDSKTLATCSAKAPLARELTNGQIKIWDVATGRNTATYEDDPRPPFSLKPQFYAVVNDFYCVAFAPDGKNLASAGSRLKFRDFASGKITALPKAGAVGANHTLTYTDDDKLFAASERFASLWDSLDREPIAMIESADRQGFQCAAISSVGSHIALGSGSGIMLWKVSDLTKANK